MLKKLILKLKYFYNLDLRRKLQKIKLYPNNFLSTGFVGIYNKFIFFILFNYRYKRYRKKIFNKIFNDKIKDNKNCLVSLPRSGSMFVRCSLSSYIELFNNIGDGIPKYDSINDKWIFAYRPILESNLWGLLDPEKFNSSLFVSGNQLDKNITFTRYPASEVDIFDIKDCRPIVLFRSPFDQIVSLYNKHQYKFSEPKNNINLELLKNSISTYQDYTNFWLKFRQGKKSKHDYLFINYENLINNSTQVFSEILSFFNYPIDMEFVKKSVEINSKDNTLERLKNIKIKKIRFTDPKKLEETSDRIKELFYNKLDGKILDTIYKNIND